MKISKLLVLGVLVVALGTATSVFAQCAPAVSVGITSVPSASQGDIINYDVTVTVGASQCPWSGGTVTVTLPDLSEVVLAAGTLSLAPGETETYSGVAPYTVHYDDLGEYDDPLGQLLGDPPGPDEVRAGVTVAGTSDTGEGTQSAGAMANWDTTFEATPGINVEKVAVPDGFCLDSTIPITYTYTVTNTGDIDLENITLVDDTSPCTSPTYDSGDVGGDGILGLTEEWIYVCIAPTPTEEVTNIATVTGYDVAFGTMVQDTATETVVVNPPPEVSVDPEAIEICEVIGEVELCAEVEELTGTPPFTYEWVEISLPDTVIGTDSCLTVSETGEYCVTVTDAAGCEDEACSIVTVIPQPDCSFDNPTTSICEEDIDIPVEYCTLVVADNYEWEVMSGPGHTEGPIDGMCVDVVPTDLGTIVLELRVWNDVAPDGSCGNSCQISILVEECGGGYCTFTQGFYGNEGGKACDANTTTEIIEAVILPDNPVIVGGLALDGLNPFATGPSITFDSAACIIQRLPCGGKPSPLPDDLGNVNCTDQTALKDAKLLKKKDDRIANTLVGQTVALTLNLRLNTIPCMDEGFDQPLSEYVFPAPDDSEDVYICVQQGEEGCIERYMVPESLYGVPVWVVLDLANEALAGNVDLVDGAYEGASFINELFDECWTIVSCPPLDSCEYCDPVDDCVVY